MARYATAGDMINQVAAEVGVQPVSAPYSSTDPTFVQLTYLTTTAGRILGELYEWEEFAKLFTQATLSTDTGNYPLPADFGRMVNQTAWEKTKQFPIFGPMSAQQWRYLQFSGFGPSSVIYASFRLQEGTFSIFPQPPPTGLNLNFEYQSRNWVQDGTSPNLYKDKPEKESDLILYEPVLFSSYLRLRWLLAKGFDISGADAEFTRMLESRMGHDKGAPVLYAGYIPGPRYLGYSNVPETGYGLP